MIKSVFYKRMPSGVPGDITRNEFLNDEAQKLDESRAPTAFGVPLKIVAGGLWAKIEAGDKADSVKGFLVRRAPSYGGSPDEGGNSQGPDSKRIQMIMKVGYLCVLCTVGTPTMGGAVYMRVVAATGKAIGDLEADADGVNNVLLPTVTWAVEGKDADNITEIRVME